ncbi:aliphatic sulfonate ABC transporter substrate-binding protein [Microbacterium sp. ARD32]|uniref:aliphatic sulfonate ABC transporter substrate-binding protein n=1 Tax=Microbacterium sp. ARD32 TaxID=2962577 RepID=UPI002880BFFA|nr:aliphatic sulfonate ABC transporter substrate-binding protein [Microbacterium sp. ARD32]MDT0158216.1 aliphatic sulfonate ABC transporter substrate-binding protein [Microbacterium sp. ARD32]
MTSITRRALVGGTVAAVALAALTACSGPATDTKVDGEKTIHVTAGYTSDGNGALLQAVAQKQGIWKKHGLEVDATPFTNGPLQIQALGTGDLDFGYIGPGALWLPMSGKAKIVAVQGLGTADRVIAQEGIEKIEDLKGKTVGVPEGTSGDMLLNLALEKAGMSIDDVEKVAMDPPTVISAFTSKQVDAAAIWYPFVDQIHKNVPGMVEVVKSADFPDLAFPATLVAGTDITDDAEMLQRYQAAAKEAYTWAAAHKDELPALLADFLKAPKDSVASEFEYVDLLAPDDLLAKWDSGDAKAWFTNLNKQFIQMDKVADEVDPADYILIEQYRKA